MSVKIITCKNVNRKVQGVPQSQIAASLWHQEEENNDNKQRVQNKRTKAREAYRPALSSPKDDLNVERIENNMRTKSKAMLNMKRPVVKTQNQTK